MNRLSNNLIFTKKNDECKNRQLDNFVNFVADNINNSSSSWKEIKGFVGFFINQCGEIKNSKGKFLIPRPIGRQGYLAVRIQIMRKVNYVYIHRAVAVAFISNPEKKPVVNHIDGNKQNNHLDNLEWVTASENLKHAYRTGLRKPNHVRNSGMYLKGSNINPKSKKEGGICEV